MKNTERIYAMKILNKWEMLKRAEVSVECKEAIPQTGFRVAGGRGRGALFALHPSPRSSEPALCLTGRRLGLAATSFWAFLLCCLASPCCSKPHLSFWVALSSFALEALPTGGSRHLGQIPVQTIALGRT